MRAWRELCAPVEVMRALHEKGFYTPTPIQSALLPAAIKGRMDVMGAAETGSGKTLAFGIPILNGILEDIEREEREGVQEDEDDEDGDEEEVDLEPELIDDSNFEDMSDEEGVDGVGCVRVINDIQFDFDEDGGGEDMFMPPVLEDIEFEDDGDNKHARKKSKGKLRALILTPTRELAIQVRDHLVAAAKYTPIKVVAVVGGMAAQKQLRLLSYGPDIVVATPGRLWDLIQEGNPHLSQAKDVK